MDLNPLLISVGNTLLAIIVCLLLAIPIGAFFAALLTRSNLYGRRFGAIALASQLAVPLYVFAGGWAAGLGLQGWMRVDSWLGPTGLSWMQGWFGKLLAVGLIHALASIPWVSLILSLGLLTCDRSEEEMALLDGGWSMLVRRVWWPRLRAWVAVACLWCCMGLLTEMVVSNLYMFSTIAERVYQDVSRDTVSPLTYIIAVFLVTLPIFALSWRLTRRLPPLRDVLVKSQHFSAYEIPLGKHRWAISTAFWFLTLIFVGLPLVNLTMKAGWTPVVEHARTVGFTWTPQRFWQTIVESLTLFQSEFYWSIMLAVGSSLTAVLMGMLLYWITSKRRDVATTTTASNPLRSSIHVLMLLLVSIPGPMVGMLLARALNQPGWLGEVYYRTLAAPIVAQQFRLLPLAWLLICGLMATISVRSWELAFSDGLNRWQVLRSILWPQIGKRTIVAVILLMLMSIGELSCSMGVLPPGVTTTSMRLFEILHFGMRHQDSGLCGVLVLLGWSAALLMRRIAR